MAFLHEVGISVVGAKPPTGVDPIHVHHIRINDHAFGKYPTQDRPDWVWCVPLLMSQHQLAHKNEKAFWSLNGFHHEGLRTGPNALALILTGFSCLGDADVARRWIRSINDAAFVT